MTWTISASQVLLLKRLEQLYNIHMIACLSDIQCCCALFGCDFSIRTSIKQDAYDICVATSSSCDQGCFTTAVAYVEPSVGLNKDLDDISETI